jgi:hypothetical protein
MFLHPPQMWRFKPGPLIRLDVVLTTACQIDRSWSRPENSFLDIGKFRSIFSTTRETHSVSLPKAQYYDLANLIPRHAQRCMTVFGRQGTQKPLLTSDSVKMAANVQSMSWPTNQQVLFQTQYYPHFIQLNCSRVLMTCITEKIVSSVTL